ncbi:molecular chaperone [Serratia marcescens]|uniref:molecular chaperone n=2 Tax=Bacteria TaxID=2 RepID=UPI002022F59E
MRDHGPELLTLENNEPYLPSMLCAPTREAVSECLHRHWQVPTGSEENQQLLRRAISYNREEDIPVNGDSVLFGLQALAHYMEDPEEVYFVRSPKSFLGANGLKPQQIALFEDLVCAMMFHIKRQAENVLQTGIEQAVIGRPINFQGIGGEEANRQAQGILQRAAERAGFKAIEFQFEPVAAGLDFEATLSEEQTVLVVDIGGGTTDLAITHYSLDDGVGNNIKINPRLLFREGFKVAGDDILLDAIQQFILPAVQQAFEAAGVSAAPALMDRLFGNEGRMDGLSTLRQQAALQIFMPAGRALLGAYEEYDPLDSRAEIAASLGDLLPQPPTPQVLAFINGEVQREADSDAFEILHTPLVIRLADLHAAFLSDRIGIGRCLRLLAEVVALYTCDVLLLTGRPARFPGVQALLRHLQPLPASRILPLEGYHTRSWYPFNKRGRIDNPKSTAAVGAMLCLLAIDLRLESFYFNVGDFQPYSTIRHLGMLDGNNMLADDNVYYRDIDLDRADFALDPAGSFQLRGPLRLGFRQLDNERWPASPLYTLTINDAQLARKLAGDAVITLRLAITASAEQGAESVRIAQALLADGSPVPAHHLQLKLNTLAASASGATHYWIDSGSIYPR